MVCVVVFLVCVCCIGFVVDLFCLLLMFVIVFVIVVLVGFLVL